MESIDDDLCNNIYPHTMDTYDIICKYLQNNYICISVNDCAIDILSNIDIKVCNRCVDSNIRIIAKTLFDWFNNHDSFKNWICAEYIVNYINNPLS